MSNAQRGRIPSLDGLRALAVASVFYGHLAGTVGAFPERIFRITGDLGNLGVRAFFVMSGFLITTLLLREKDRTGTISLRGFYSRRALRLLPVFYAFLLVAAILSRVRVLQVPAWNFAPTALFVTNLFDVDWNLGHFWSLAIEEQFYLVWPAFLLLAGARRAMRCSLFVFVVTPLLHVVAFKLGSEPWARFSLSINAISIGCVLAGLRPLLHKCSVYMRLLGSRLVWFVAVSVWLCNMWTGHFSYLLFAYSSLALAFIIDRVSTYPTGAARVLNWRPIVFIGAISYSLYVWQQVFLDRYSQLGICRFPLNLILALGCGLASYYAIEKPLIRWRQSLKAKKKQSVQAMQSGIQINPVPVADAI
ncbi:MAG: acyltransferase [Bryobacteraceae bacterium]